MFKLRANKRHIALSLAALIIFFAPLIHAICVSAPMTTGTAIAHVMPDGSVMQMGSDANAETQGNPTSPAQPTAPVEKNVFIVLVLAPALTLLLAVIYLKHKELLVFRLQNSHVVGLAKPPPIRIGLTRVNLIELGISRT